MMTAATATAPATDRLEPRTAVWVFMAFAAAYFCSALVRAITATLSPVLTQDFSLQARDLGLLAQWLAAAVPGVGRRNRPFV